MELPMAIEITTFFDSVLSHFSPFITCPAAGAVLKEFSPEFPMGQSKGIVLASPNILRPYHPGFNPSSAERCRFEGDFMDKVIFISECDYTNAAHPEWKEFADKLAFYLAVLGRLADPDPSTGCSPSSCGTPLYQLVFDPASPTGVRFPMLPDRYTVVAAAFANVPGMFCTEYWIATHANQELILNSPQYAAARQRSMDNCPPDALRRRQRTLEQISRLQKSDLSQVFQTSGC
jgi:hypothetical protein